MNLPGETIELLPPHGANFFDVVVVTKKDLIEFIKARERKAFRAGHEIDPESDIYEPEDKYRDFEDYEKSEDYKK